MTPNARNTNRNKFRSVLDTYTHTHTHTQIQDISSKFSDHFLYAPYGNTDIIIPSLPRSDINLASELVVYNCGFGANPKYLEVVRADFCRTWTLIWKLNHELSWNFSWKREDERGNQGSIVFYVWQRYNEPCNIFWVDTEVPRRKGMCVFDDEWEGRPITAHSKAMVVRVKPKINKNCCALLWDVAGSVGKIGFL